MSLTYLDDPPDHENHPWEHSRDCACLLCQTFWGEYDPESAMDLETYPCWGCGEGEGELGHLCRACGEEV